MTWNYVESVSFPIKCSGRQDSKPATEKASEPATGGCYLYLAYVYRNRSVTPFCPSGERKRSTSGRCKRALSRYNSACNPGPRGVCRIPHSLCNTRRSSGNRQSPRCAPKSQGAISMQGEKGFTDIHWLQPAPERKL